MKYYNYIMILLTIMLMFISLPKDFSKIYSYEDVIFYPNESQSINISKLYIDYSNPNTFSLYIYYNNASDYIPYPKNITVDVPPNKINISINISASRNNNIWTIFYKIYNNYNFNITLNVSFPKGYNITNVSNINIPPSSYKLIKLKRYLNSDKIHFNDSNISFKVPSRIKIRYSKSIPFSITKSSRPLNNKTEWTATYTINNTQNITLTTNVTYWAIVNNSKINLGNESSILKPNGSIIRTFNINIPNGEVPIFYVNFKAWHDAYKNITIIPAFKINNKYIIGISKVKGLNFYMPYNTYPPSPPPTTIPKHHKHPKTTTPPSPPTPPNPHKITIPTNNNNKPTSSSHNTKTKETSEETSENTEHEESKPKELKLFNVVIKQPTVTILSKKIKSAVVFNGVISPIILALLPLLYLNRRKTLIIGNNKLPDELLTMIYSEFKDVIIPEGCEGCNPKNLYNPIIYEFSDEEWLDIIDLHELKDIPLNDAKAIVSALNTTRSVVYLSDKKSYEIAIDIGLEVYYNDGQYSNW